MTASTEFFAVKTPDALRRLLAAMPRLDAERVPLDGALDRVLARDLIAAEDLPDGDRATMDGFALRAVDSFGASESLPLPLELIGAVAMGERPTLQVGKGQCAQIPTGGYLPAGADAVLMIEQANPASGQLVEVFRPVTAGENVLRRGEDVQAGQTVLAAGRRIAPWDIGLLAALGVTALELYRRPRVVVLSTGDEVVPVEATPAPGQIRDANAHAVAALLRGAGCAVEQGGIVVDRAGPLREALTAAVARADVVVLSGGSSVGERDLMPQVVGELERAEVLLHGVAMRPGKPTLLARVGDTTLFGLPGHPVSALMVAQVFLVPFVRYLAGAPLQPGPLGPRVQARLASSIHSVQGREDYVRVRLEPADDAWQALPLYGKSAMLSSLVRADGVVVVPMNAEGLARGEAVDVIRFAVDDAVPRG